jgi:hypothetical protein
MITAALPYPRQPARGLAAAVVRAILAFGLFVVLLLVVRRLASRRG